MLPYFCFLVIVLLFAYLTFRGKEQNPVAFMFLYAVMALFAALRSLLVGTDSASYARSFQNSVGEQLQFESGLDALTSEPAFAYLEIILGNISSEYFILFLGIAVIFTFFVLHSISRNSVAPVLSLFVFITLGYYTFVFNAARQAIAMAIYMTSIPSLLQRKFWRYVVIVLISALFHKTIIIAIPLYFIFTMRYSFKSLVIVLAGSLLVSYLLPSFLSSAATLEDRYALYLEGSASRGYFLTFFYVILSVFFILQRNFMKKDALGSYDVFLLMLISGSVIYLVVSLTGSYVELTRFAAYFQIASIFLWSMLAKERRTPLSKEVYILAIIGHLVYFTIYLSRMANLVPYTFNPNIFNF